MNLNNEEKSRKDGFLSEEEDAAAEAAATAADAADETEAAGGAEETGKAAASAAARRKNPFASRKFKYGTMATVLTVVFLAALVLVNVVATLLLERYPLTIDLNSDKRFSLTQESIDYLGTLDQEVRVYVCADEDTFENANEYYKQAYEVIRNYTRYSSRISLTFVDLLSNPGFASGYPDYTLYTGDIIVETDLRNKRLTSSDLFNIEVSNYGYTQTVTSSKAEQAMTGAIMYVTDRDPVTVGVLNTDGLTDVSGYVSLLESNNYAIQEINLLTEEIPSDLEFVILGQPSADLTADQITKLETYLSNNEQYEKGLVFVASAQRTVGSRLAAFLEDWGLEVGTGFVLETDTSRMYGDPRIMLGQLTGSDYLSGMNSQGSAIMVPLSRPINLLFEADSNRTTETLLTTAATGVIMPEEGFSEDVTYDSLPKAERNLVAISTRTLYDNLTPKVSYVVVYGSEMMLQSSFLQEASMNNADFALTLTNSLAEKEEGLKIVPVDFTSTTITITQAQSNVFLVVLVIVIPLAILGTALVVYLRRRHL